MTRRMFWFVMGVTIGVLVVRKLSQLAQKLTPSGMAEGFAGGLRELADSIRDFAADVREAMADREVELRRATGLAASGSESGAEPVA